MAAQQMGGSSVLNVPIYDIALTPEELAEQLESTMDLLCRRQTELRRFQQSELQQKIVNYLNENFRKCDLSLSEVAKHFGFSERAALAEITACTGLGFSAYVQKLRMEEGARLLTQSGMRVQEACDACGYSLLSTFHKAFKKYYGITPVSYTHLDVYKRQR